MDLKIIILILFLVFVTLLVLMVISVAKKRKKAHQIIEAVSDFAQRVNYEKEIYYSFFEKKDQLIDQQGKLVKILEGICACEIIYPPISLRSRVPSKCYRIAVAKGGFRDKDDTHTENIIEFHLRPAKVTIHNWKVVRCNRKGLLLEHPIMGTLEFTDKRYREQYAVGQAVSLRQESRKISSYTYSLDYWIIS